MYHCFIVIVTLLTVLISEIIGQSLFCVKGGFPSNLGVLVFYYVIFS